MSLALGLVFVFVRSPLPWGREGFDFYHERALTLARHGTFETTDVPWGYVAFLASWYRVFGDKPWIPLTVQVVLNAAVPVMIFALARRWFDERTSALAAVLCGVASFNTLYASTQSSDAVCNVIFVAATLVYAVGLPERRRRYAAGAGLLLGLALQFRPNLLLFPFVLGAATVAAAWRSATVRRYALVMVVLAAAADVPWTVRNYRATGLFLPTSTHGATQLFYGSLETGPYLNARMQNPRWMFESSPLPYSTVANAPVIVTARAGNCSPAPPLVEFWTDRRPEKHRISPTVAGDRLGYDIPGQPIPTAIYYRVVSPISGATLGVTGSADPFFVFFITDDHLHDIDRHEDLLDVFDVARIAAHVAWRDPLPFADRLDADRDGAVTRADLDAAVKALLWSLPGWSGRWLPPPSDVIRAFDVHGNRASLRFSDGSSMTVPRGFTKSTELEVTRGLAAQLAFATRPIGDFASGATPSVPPCRGLLDVAVNGVFYRHGVDDMRRHSALALDNIRQHPAAFLAAAAYRAARVFIIVGSPDNDEARQFAGSARLYRLGTIVSVVVVVLFVAGIVVLLRRREFPWLLLLPPIYVSATIAPFFTNMRYTITVQPFIFVFVAVALVAAYDRLTRGSSGPAPVQSRQFSS